ncbi:MAG: hypothetical protein ACXV8O_16700 [Methylobacter sp.]
MTTSVQSIIDFLAEHASSTALTSDQVTSLVSQLKGQLNNHRLKPVGLSNGLKVRIRVA